MAEEKKSSYKGYTQARGRASQKYQKEHLERVAFWVRKGEKERYKAAAAAAGASLAQFLNDAAEEKIKRDGLL